MSEKIPVRTDPNYLFAEFQPGDFIGVQHGGFGGSTLPQLLSSVGNTSALWNASALRGIPLSAILSPSTGQSLVYSGSVWIASTVAGTSITALSALTDTTIGTPTTSDVLTWNGTKWVPAVPPGAVGGESNTASNLGAGPGSSFVSKVGVDLQFRTLSGINLVVSNVGNVILVSGQTSTAFTANSQIDHTGIQNIGTNTHTQIDSHIASVANPHSVTAAQVGNITAQWNASAIRSNALSATLVPTTGQSLVYNGSLWTASTVTASPTGGITSINSQTGAAQTITVTSGLGALQGTDALTIGANYTSAIWNASALRTSPLSSTLVPTTGQSLIYNGSLWTASTIDLAGGPGGADGVNIGGAPGSSFSSKIGSDLQFRTISGINVIVSTVGNVILVSGQTSAAFTNASQIDHGSLAGLYPDNDHPQYTLSATNLQLSTNVSNHLTSTTVHFLQTEIDHGNLLGRSDDDHPQYVLSATNTTLSSNVSNHIASSTVHFTSGSLSGYYAGSAWTELRYAGSAHNHAVSTLTDTNIGVPVTGQILTWGGTNWTPSTSPAGVTAHNLLTGLSNDDHPQYTLSATNLNLSNAVTNHITSSTVHFTSGSLSGYYAGSAWTELRYAGSAHNHGLSTLSDVSIAGPTAGQVLTWGGSNWTPSTSPAGVTNHSLLTNLNANDHPQYTLSATNLNLSNAVSNHLTSTTVHFLQTEIDHGNLLGRGDDDHPQYTLSATNLNLSNTVSNHIASSTVHFTIESLSTIPGYVLSSTNLNLSNSVSNHIASATVHFTAASLSTTPGYVLSATNLNLSNAVSNHLTSTTVHFTIESLSTIPGYVLSSTNLNLSTSVSNHIASAAVHFTEASINHASIQNIGTNTHAQIDSHIGSVANPHSVTAEQVGNITSQWNASALRSTGLSATLVPTTNQALIYNGSVWTASTLPTAAPGGGITSLNGQTGVAQTITATSGLGLLQGTDTMAIGADYTSAIWNASALYGTRVITAGLGTGQVLTYDGADWVNSPGVTINSESGPTFTIIGASGTVVDVPGTNSIRISSPSSTTLISEGTNLYYTDVRADARALLKIGNAVLAGDGLNRAYDEGQETYTFNANYTSSVWNASALKGSPLSATLVPVSGQALMYDGSVWSASTIYNTINFVIDGGGSVISTGVKGDIVVDYNATIVSVTTLADQSGSIVVDIWKDTYANYPPTDADSITASAPPTLSSATKAQDTTLTGWIKTITAGDTIRFNVDSATTVTRVTIALKVSRR